ncbi:hypothetical protein TST_0733 [Thermosulfidibacter takaii ABI70S6]|uniref:Uncharacterized protein n=1 Tax=Thermosulfidibacter takaii (strain DSM 17441 / JCM 13301 / NBRC 103674 / ABI70S6) TaxID=1298851 RepID=A0A0S3QT77_THET7|nr:hypothetical protein [Thermosulfidibacter takaii]BAT71538.1 hypothetical protein TST_0733 [Thermosulfidibacter takaii ABI70S6]
MYKKVIMIGIIFTFLLLLNGITKAETAGTLFVKAYVGKDASTAAKVMVPPNPFYQEMVKEISKRTNTDLNTMSAKIQRLIHAREEIFKYCLFNYVPFVSYKELSETPEGQYTKLFYMYGMEPEDRSYFENQLNCRNRLFEMKTPKKETLYLLLEECSAQNSNGTWVERMAIFSPGEGNLELMQCAVDKIKKAMSDEAK